MRYEVMREIGIHCQRLANTQLLHHDEAQAINKTVLLVLVALEVFEGGTFLIRRSPVKFCQLARISLLPETNSFRMTDSSG